MGKRKIIDALKTSKQRSYDTYQEIGKKLLFDLGNMIIIIGSFHLNALNANIGFQVIPKSSRGLVRVPELHVRPQLQDHLAVGGSNQHGEPVRSLSQW